MAVVVVICMFIFYINNVYCKVPAESQNDNLEGPKVEEQTHIIHEVTVAPISKVKSGSKPSIKNNLSSTFKPNIGVNIKSNTNSYIIESGAVMRGVFVFVAITLLFIIYLVFKTYRKTNRKKVIVKKYGVKARKTDTEMEPLQLDDDEEDETLFEVRNVNNR